MEETRSPPTVVDGDDDRRDSPRRAATPASAFDPPAARFESLGELGRGGMGRVEDAFDVALGRQVAIKHMLSASPSDVARFEREARITARLEHPGIVPIHDAGRGPDGVPYYVMRRVDGRPLDDVVEDKSASERLALVQHVLAACDAVGFAHARGIVHRDLKPANILLGPFGETLVIDWGLAREVRDRTGDTGASLGSGDGLTRAGTVAGTPGFMAPEQARGEDVDARADVFALGATLFHVLAGRAPYGSASATTIIDAVGRGRAPDWELVPSEVPADLRAIVMKAMASEPADRYPDAGAFASDLRRFLAGRLVAAHTYGTLEQIRRFARRHRAVLSAIAIALVVVAGIGIVSIRRVVDERDTADDMRRQAETGRHEAQDARDDLLVKRAAELAISDPIGAVALLRELPVESSRWSDAWGAAQTALSHGIPSGFVVDVDGVQTLDVSPDSRHLVAVGKRGGVEVIDLETRTRDTLVASSDLVWCSYFLRGARIACRGMESLVVFDAATKQRRSVKVDGFLKMFVAAGGDRLYVHVGDAVVPYDDARNELGPPIQRGVDMLRAVDGTDRLLFRTDHEILAWSPDKLVTLAKHDGETAIATSRGRAMLRIGEAKGQIWKLDGEPVLERAFDMPKHAIILGLAHGSVYMSARHLVVNDGSSRDVDTIVPISFGFADGVVLFQTASGNVVLIDDDGWFSIDNVPQAYTRFDISPDRRFLVAATAHGTVQWWDLAAFRPRAASTRVEDRLVRVSPTAVWTSTLQGLTRTDRATGRTHTIAAVDNGGNSVIDPGERYVLSYTPLAVSVVDLTTEKQVFVSSGGLVRTYAGSTARIAIAMSDNTIQEVEVGTWKAATLGKVPFTVQIITTAGGAVAATGSADACRFSGAGEECRTLADKIDAAQIDVTGTLWLVAGGKLYRWPAGGEPTVLELDLHLTGLVVVDDAVVAWAPTAFVPIEQPLRPILSPPIAHLSGAGGKIAFSTPNGEIELLDLATRSFTAFGRQSLDAIATDGNEVIAYTPDNLGRIWTISLPREPDQLRAWLERATNARKTTGGLVSFP